MDRKSKDSLRWSTSTAKNLLKSAKGAGIHDLQRSALFRTIIGGVLPKISRPVAPETALPASSKTGNTMANPFDQDPQGVASTPATPTFY